MSPPWPKFRFSDPNTIAEYATGVISHCDILDDHQRTYQRKTMSASVLMEFVAAVKAFADYVRKDNEDSKLSLVLKTTQLLQDDLDVIKHRTAQLPLKGAQFSKTPAYPTDAHWAQQVLTPLFQQYMAQQSNHGSNSSHPTFTPIPSSTTTKSLTIRISIQHEPTRQALRTSTHSTTGPRDYINQYLDDKQINAKVDGARQLESGDVEIYPQSVFDTELLLRHSVKWLPCFGAGAAIITESYGITLHGVRVASMDMSDAGKEKMISLLRMWNPKKIHTDSVVTYLGWLTKFRVGKKSHSSIVLEFASPEDANAALDQGLTWEGQLKFAEIYDRRLRLLQCNNCYHYGHSGTRCHAPVKCGRCSGSHHKDQCNNKSQTRCVVCHGDHVAWSHNCPRRKRELEEIDKIPRLSRYPVLHPSQSCTGTQSDAGSTTDSDPCIGPTDNKGKLPASSLRRELQASPTRKRKRSDAEILMVETAKYGTSQYKKHRTGWTPDPVSSAPVTPQRLADTPEESKPLTLLNPEAPEPNNWTRYFETEMADEEEEEYVGGESDEEADTLDNIPL